MDQNEITEAEVFDTALKRFHMTQGAAAA